MNVQDYLTEVERRQGGETESMDGSDEDSDICVPTRETLTEAFAKMPGECTNEEREAVKFFYKVPLLTSEKRLRQKGVMQVNSVMGLLGNYWKHCMGYALTLVEKMSDMENIIQNSQTKGDTNAKKRRQKMMTKKKRSEFAETYYLNVKYFKDAKNTNADEAEARFMEWDKLAGIITDPEKSAAQKRPSVAPSGGQSKKQKVDEDVKRELPVCLKEMLEGLGDSTDQEYGNAELPPLFISANSSDTTNSDDMAVAREQGRQLQSARV